MSNFLYRLGRGAVRRRRLVLGILGVVIGLALVVVGVRKQARGLEVLPHAGPQGAGLLLQGRF